MRLAFITQDFPPETGGIQTYSYELANELHQLCDYFILIAPAKKNQEEVDAKLPYDIIRIPSSNTLLGIQLIPKLKKIVTKHQITGTFHAQWQTVVATLTLKNQKKLTAIFVAAHGRELLFHPFKNIPILKQLYDTYQKKLLKGVNQFFPVSNYTANLLKQQSIPTNKITVIPNGTDFKNFYPSPYAHLITKWNLADKKILFTICRHVERKGIQYVLAALPTILQSIPNIHYLIGGTGNYTPTLKSLVSQLQLESHVTFVGRIPNNELNAYYSLCDIFIMTPKEVVPNVEGFGIVYLEANACGKPVIGTISGGVPNAIKHQETGLLIPQKSTAAISAEVVQLMEQEDYRLQLGVNGLDWVKTEMNWAVVAKKLFEQMQLR